SNQTSPRVVRAAHTTPLGKAQSKLCGEGAERVEYSARRSECQAQPAFSGGKTAPILRKINCWRLSSRALGRAGLSIRGLMIAAASSAASGGPSSDALV